MGVIVAFIAMTSFRHTASLALVQARKDGERETICGGTHHVNVYPGYTSARHCTVSGEALSKAVVGTAAQITLQVKFKVLSIGQILRDCRLLIWPNLGLRFQARDMFGNKRVSGGDDVQLQLSTSVHSIAADVLDKNDGTYDLQFKSDHAGLYRLHMSVNGETIWSSPPATQLLPGLADRAPTPPMALHLASCRISLIYMLGSNSEPFVDG